MCVCVYVFVFVFVCVCVCVDGGSNTKKEQVVPDNMVARSPSQK